MSWDLSILQWFVDLRNPILDKISYYITMLGSENFYMIALTVIFWCISKRFGRKWYWRPFYQITLIAH